MTLKLEQIVLRLRCLLELRTAAGVKIPCTLFWDYRGGHAVRRGRWKLVVNERGLKRGSALFDLDNDPGEKQNAALWNPEQTRKMPAPLEVWNQDIAAGAARQSSPA